tara:strand:+ start:179 stop:430 length:252 start_codon:yes stop_codon:yes gene_type:complete
MTTFLFKFKELPPLIKTRQVAKVLFDDDSDAMCQRIKRLTERGQFPKPTIPSIKPGGTNLYSSEMLMKWYQEKTNENKPLRSD